MARPLWLLDIDGVVNSLVDRITDTPYGKQTDWLRFHQRIYTGLLFPIVANRAVVDYIRTVHESGRAEVRWLTTWEDNDEYRALAQALGLPEFAVEARQAEFTPLEMLDHGMWWKLPAVIRVLAREPDRPVLWTDDEIELRSSARRWCRAQVDDRTDLMVIAPDSESGLTPYQLTLIDKFLTSV